MEPKRQNKVLRLRILKPADKRTWAELAQVLREARYRVFRLGNLAVSEAYLNFHVWRTGKAAEFTKSTVGQLNRQLRSMLIEEASKRKAKKSQTTAFDENFFSPVGALPASVTDALAKFKVGALTSPAKWKEVITGKATLPTFRLNGPIYIRAEDKPGEKKHRRIERTETGSVEVDLMICRAPYPRVVLATKEKGVGDSQIAILNRLLENSTQSLDGYRQRCFEIKHDEESNKWWLYITYDFPAAAPTSLSPEVVVGVDVGFSCPLYVALNTGHARLGRQQYAALGTRIRSLQRQTMARRRSVQRGNRANLSNTTARSGHGRSRMLQPTNVLEGRVNRAYRTLNHQLSASVIDFARNHSAGVIQIEKLEGLKNHLRGTYIGMNWRYHELHQFLEYKAKEAGIKLERVNPRFTSRRCSKCGFINPSFDRAARDSAARPGFSARFNCASPKCDHHNIDADYNAAKNLAVLDIEALIQRQCELQGISCDALLQAEVEAVDHGNASPLGNRDPAAEGRPARPEG